MLLQKLTLRNFRCFERFELPVDGRLSVLIGENDCGKTVLLDAVQTLLSSHGLRDEHVRLTPKGRRAEPVSIEGEFLLEEHDALPDEYRCGDSKDRFLLKRTFAKGTVKTYVMGLNYSDDRFNDDMFKGADTQKELLKEYRLKPAGREPERRAQRAELVSVGKLSVAQAEVELPSFAPLLEYLPRVERISSTEYKDPDSMIQRTLQAAVASVISPVDPRTGEPRELPSLRKVRKQLKDRLIEEIKKAESTLKKHHTRLRALSAEPNIDFTRCLMTTNIAVDAGEGTHLLESFGEGTKKRVWMGLLEWEREASSAASQSVIRLYDEPDINLHYEAQRELFRTISELTASDTHRTQCFVCTHSVFLIDRAPLRAINLLTMDDDSKRDLARVAEPETEEIVNFFNDIGKSVGLTNTALLYERAFLVVEGESEEASIPVFYKKLYYTTMAEDGVLLINLHSCGAWKSVLELLLKNRIHLTHMLLDRDCTIPGSSACLTTQRLTEAGCGPDFLTDQVTFIGAKEFEDSFDDSLICSMLNAHYPLDNGGTWTPTDISSVRVRGPKFSDDLKREIISRCIPTCRNRARKSEIARAIAETCTGGADVPEALRDALTEVRRIAGAT